MTRGRWLVVAALALAGVAVIAFAAVRPSGPGPYLADRYRLVSSEGDSRVYRADVPPRQVFDDLRRAVPPAEVLTDPGGYFLRYRNDIVAVTSEGTGSRVYLDDSDRGYARWFPFIGGYWGTYTGPAEGVRGGGPGSGK